MKILTNYDTATQEEIDKLKRTLKLVKAANLRTKLEQSTSTSEIKHDDRTDCVANKEQGEPIPSPAPRPKKNYNNQKSEDLDWIANVQVTKEPLKFSTPVELFMLLMPEVTLYKWQVEQLLLMAGFVEAGNLDRREVIDDNHPLLQTLSAANGSGKDLVVISIFAVWFALTGVRNRVIITSSSFDQTKSQTEVHIREFANRANKQFGKIFHYTQFHYVVPELGSEIKLFATDEEARAEGWHPYPGGKMALILNEAKSIREELFAAIDRCTGYSYLLYISSPGRKRGRMFKSTADAICYPQPAKLGYFYFRRVTAFECPHISRAHIDRLIYEKGESDPWVRSSIFAEFSDYNEPIIISEEWFDRVQEMNIAAQGDDIGIGLDWAGGGDEHYCYVRKGNKVILHFGFRQKDSEIAVPFIDKKLSAYKNTDYVFRADDGGLGKPNIDKLIRLGWRVRRTNNQSPAYKKSEFLNLGAEMYFHVMRLIQRADIVIPKDDPKLKLQLCSRRHKGEESAQGKMSLESKKEHIAGGHDSPDHADSFVLCFASYHPPMVDKPKEASKEPRTYTVAELQRMANNGSLFRMMRAQQPRLPGIRKSLIQKI